MNTSNSRNGTEPNALSELQKLENEVRQGIGAFALDKKSPKLSHAVRWLERTDSLQKRYEGVLTEACELIREGRVLLSANAPVEEERPERPADHEASSQESTSTRGGKARGRECRLAYVEQQAKQGKSLTRVRGALHKNGTGVVVGIAYAKERKNEWFLGLPAGQFQEAILLCETNDGPIQPIYLSKNFIEEYGKRLSVSRQYDQAKFNIQRRAGRYCLVVNGREVELTGHAIGEPFVCPVFEYA